jgi:LmbE family N-acetylglucosaminyl deacetylase
MLREEQEIIPYQKRDLTGRRVLVFSPHPDDETIGCGGSLALHARAGDPVKVIFLTNGARGDFSGKTNRDEYIDLRRKEAVRASQVLGIQDVAFWGYEDRNLAGSKGAISKMIRELEENNPQLVYVPSPFEFHPDHRAASFFVCEAIGGCSWENEVAFYEIGQPIWVNCLVDISGVLEQKKNAMKVYESQLREASYDEISLGLNRFRSLTLPEGITHAEGFSLWRSDSLKEKGVLTLPYYLMNRVRADYNVLKDLLEDK